MRVLLLLVISSADTELRSATAERGLARSNFRVAKGNKAFLDNIFKLYYNGVCSISLISGPGTRRIMRAA